MCGCSYSYVCVLSHVFCVCACVSDTDLAWGEFASMRELHGRMCMSAYMNLFMCVSVPLRVDVCVCVYVCACVCMR